MSDQYPVEGTIEDVEAWVAADPGDEDRAAMAVMYEQEREHPRTTILNKFGDDQGASPQSADTSTQADDVVSHGPGEGDPAAGDEPQVAVSADESGAVPVETRTGARLLALRSAPEPDAAEVGLPVAGQLATEDVYAEIVLPGTVTPTFQLLAKAGVVVNPGDIAALPPRG